MKYLLILITLLFSFFDVFSFEGVYRPGEPEFRENEHYYLEIDKNTSLDSLYNCINENPKKIRHFSLTFVELNEGQIDEVVNKLPFSHRSKVYSVYLYSCPIKKLPLSFREYFQMRTLTFHHCDSIETLNGFKSVQPSFALNFYFCNIRTLPEDIENIRSILSIMIVVSKDFLYFETEKVLSKLAIQNNVRALFIYNENQMLLPESLNKLSLLTHLHLIFNEKIRIPSKINNLNNLVWYEGNISYDSLLIDSIINKLDTKFIWNRFEEWNYIETETEQEILSLINNIKRQTFAYYRPIEVFYNDAIYLYVDYKLNTRRFFVWDIFSSEEKAKKFVFKNEISLNGNLFKFEKKLYEKPFKIKYSELEEETKVYIQISNYHTGEKLLSFNISSGEEIDIDLSKYPDYYFDIIFFINGELFKRKLIME